MKHGERILIQLGFILLVLAGLGPLVGRATLAQILVLAVLLAVGLYLLGDLLVLPRAPANARAWAAVADGLAAALILRYLAPAVDARFGWGGVLVLGAAVGLGEYFLYRQRTIPNVG